MHSNSILLPVCDDDREEKTGMNVLGTPFFSAWGNFENWLESSEGRLFLAAIILAIVGILYYVVYVRARRRPWRVGGRSGHGETSPRDEESETEQR